MKNTNVVSIYSIENENELRLPNLKYHVFISKQTTQELSDHIIKENWGKNNILLYKYLDYIWRFQLLDKMVKEFTFHGKKRLMFNTGLKRKSDNQDLYLCLIPNNAYSNKSITQAWRVALGFGMGNNESFVTKQDLIRIYKISEIDIPQKTDFFRNPKDSQFQKNYAFIIDWQERIRTTKNRILDTLANDIGFLGNISLQKLKNMIKQATKVGLAMARKDPKSVGKQIFIERQIIDNKQVTKGYHIELLLPLTITINDKEAYFAMVLRSDHTAKQYEGMSILTREMAYTNARLLGPVTLPWLKPFVTSNSLNKHNNQNNINHININMSNLTKQQPVQHQHHQQQYQPMQHQQHTQYRHHMNNQRSNNNNNQRMTNNLQQMQNIAALQAMQNLQNFQNMPNLQNLQNFQNNNNNNNNNQSPPNMQNFTSLPTFAGLSNASPMQNVLTGLPTQTPSLETLTNKLSFQSNISAVSNVSNVSNQSNVQNNNNNNMNMNMQNSIPYNMLNNTGNYNSPVSSVSNFDQDSSIYSYDYTKDKSLFIAQVSGNNNKRNFKNIANNGKVNNNNRNNNNNNNNNNGNGSNNVYNPLFYLATTLPVTLPVSLPKMASLPEGLGLQMNNGMSFNAPKSQTPPQQSFGFNNNNFNNFCF